MALLMHVSTTGLISLTVIPASCSTEEPERFAVNLSFDLFAPFGLTDSHCRISVLTREAGDTDGAEVVDKVHPLQIGQSSRITLFTVHDPIYNYTLKEQGSHAGSIPLYLKKVSLLL
jgi:hypothetical protein